MKSSSIVVAALLSALALPVFAQTSTAAATTPAPTTTTAAPKAETTTKHKTVKHVTKAEKDKTATPTAAKTADAPAK